MTEPGLTYSAGRPARGGDVGTLPVQVVNLGRRLLDLERQCAGRGRVVVEVVFFDGKWLLSVSKPGAVELLSE